MSIQRMDHIGIVVDDLASATEFFTELGLDLMGEDVVEGEVVDRVVGLQGVHTDVAFLKTRDRQTTLELIKFNSPRHDGGEARPAPANTPGLRHLAFVVEDIDSVVARVRTRGFDLVGGLELFEDVSKICYVRGPEGMIIELEERTA